MSLLFLLPDLQGFLKVLKVQNDGTHGWNLYKSDMGSYIYDLKPESKGFEIVKPSLYPSSEIVEYSTMFKKANGALLEVGEGRDRS